MIQLTVIIVNYNVKYFLEQALLSVRKAMKSIPGEIIVVDNHSMDGSVEMIRKKFPDVKLIANEVNVGFSKANNQAIQVAQGEFILLLNPDTVVEEDTFTKCIQFMREHEDAGGMGVKMIDGKGNFLPESKRSFPSPSVAFFKAFGLSALFPRSRTFGRYHLGHLSNDEIHEVEVLAGAFMFLRKSALDKTGFLDEDFFMYGEDIDLSYRLAKAGYKNYYFPQVRIIHYKGESTRKGSLNYVRLFYQAMIIFARKHFSGSKALLFIRLVKAAVYFRAFLSILSRAVQKIILPVTDALLMYVAMWVLKNFWASNVKGADMYYPEEYMLIVVPGYVLIWITSVYFSGGYDKHATIPKIIRGLLAGTILIAAIYAFLPEAWRFSRAMILLGFMQSAFLLSGVRLIWNVLRFGSFQFGEPIKKRIVIAGSADECNRVMNLLALAGVQSEVIGYVFPEKPMNPDSHFLGEISEFAEICELYNVNEIIFCARDISSRQTIEWISRLGPEPDYKIVPEESLSIIGSNSKNLQGELYTIDIKLSIAGPSQKRNKRLFDLVTSVFLLLTLPVHLIFILNRGRFIINLFDVLAGKKTWVGYAGQSVHYDQLPQLKPGVLAPSRQRGTWLHNDHALTRVNLLYAKNFSASGDLQIVWQGYRQLGN